MLKQFKLLFNLIIIISGFYIFWNGYKIINNYEKKPSNEISNLDYKNKDSKTIIENSIKIKNPENNKILIQDKAKKKDIENKINYEEIAYKIEKNK